MTKKIFILFLIFITPNVFSQQLAFPEAEGFGRFAKGGRSGDVYHVTNLNDSGIGSLRYGIETATGPRTIVFDISGIIYQSKRLKIMHPNITIAGQTAPGDGVTLTGCGLYVQANDIIIRYIRCRLGDSNGEISDAISITNGKNIIIDHVSASWSVDETLSCQSSTVDSITVQWCLISESLTNSLHSKGEHGMGGIVGALQQSFHHNLYAHHNSRSPKVSGRRHCEVDFRNNVIYNWGKNNCYDGTSSYMNWVNNYYKAGPATQEQCRFRIFQLFDNEIEEGIHNIPEDSKKYETSLYATGNYVDGSPKITIDNWAGGIEYMEGATEAKNRALKPAFIAPVINVQSAIEAYPLVLAEAGASHKRDSIDMRIVNEVKTGTAKYGNNGIIDTPYDVGGLPTLISIKPLEDTDQDGMPDIWEKQKGLNPKNPNDRNIVNLDGYTMLEEYLDSIK
jgi:pectate lyase